jgi:uncharacterized protein (TIGR02246 family)
MAEQSLAQRMEQVIRTYFEACKDADAKGVAACFCPDAVHYFPGRARWVGADAIGSGIAKLIQDQGGYWTVDQVLTDVERSAAVVEWSNDRACRSAWRTCRRPTAVVPRPQWRPGRDISGIQRRRVARTCNSVHGGSREGRSGNPALVRTSHDGNFPVACRRHCGRASASRSHDCALRSYNSSSSVGPLWPRCERGSLGISVVSTLVDRPSCRRARRCKPRGSGCT